MIELIKKEIHMNRQRGTAVSQLTLDDDFIVPDALDDAVQILLSDGEVQIENSRIQGEKVPIRGKLVFRVPLPPGVGRAAGDGRGDSI
ncbi:MAG: DUF3794 domain-containing protein [Clostridium fessum]